MPIQPINFGKNIKHQKSAKERFKKTYAQTHIQNMPSQECETVLIKKAGFALNEAPKIKQTANSVKIKSYEVLNKARINKEFADGLYCAIKENQNSSNKNFIVSYQGTTYKVEAQNGKYRAIGQSRGFFGKKDIYEYENKKGELKIAIFKGYSKEKNSDTFSASEEYHYIENNNVVVFFDTINDKFKKAKEGFSFALEKELRVYCTNSKTKLDDFECGEYEISIAYDIYQRFRSYTTNLNSSKNSMYSKHCWTFSRDGMLETFHQDCKVKFKDESEICDIGMVIEFENNKPKAGYSNMHVANEKPVYGFEYEFK